MEGSCARSPRRAMMAVVVGLLLLGDVAAPAAAARLRISDLYSSLDRHRPLRQRTELIVLHTSEGGDRSSLRRIRAGGLANYVVAHDGHVYRIIDRRREARHAGLSMWDGSQNLDRVSVGIEVVGYHNKPVTDAQVRALRELLRQLQSIYKIPDERVVTHSMVAYGHRNRWHRADHRGRKRCGMQFARPELRARIGLQQRCTCDPDVAAGRLVQADPFLATVLYSPGRQAEQVAHTRFEGPDADVITPGAHRLVHRPRRVRFPPHHLCVSRGRECGATNAGLGAHTGGDARAGGPGRRIPGRRGAGRNDDPS